MAKNEARVRFSLSQKQFLSELQQFSASWKKMQEDMQQGMRQTEKATKDVDKNLMSWAGSMGKVLASAGLMYGAFTAVRTVVSAIREEYERMFDVQQKAVETTKTWVQVAQDLFYKLGGDEAKEFPAIQAAMLGMDPTASIETGFRVLSRMKTVSSGGASLQDMQKWAQFMVENYPLMDQGELVEIGGAVAKIMENYPGTRIEEALGMIFQGSRLAATITPAAFSQNLLSVIPQMEVAGFQGQEELRQGLSFLSAITTFTGDESGRRTAQSFAEFLNRMDKEFVSRGGQAPQGMGLLFSFLDPDNQIAQQMRREMISGELAMPGSSKFQGAMRNWFEAIEQQDTTKLEQFFLDALERIPVGEAAVAAFQQQIVDRGRVIEGREKALQDARMKEVQRRTEIVMPAPLALMDQEYYSNQLALVGAPMGDLLDARLSGIVSRFQAAAAQDPERRAEIAGGYASQMLGEVMTAMLYNAADLRDDRFYRRGPGGVLQHYTPTPGDRYKRGYWQVVQPEMLEQFKGSLPPEQEALYEAFKQQRDLFRDGGARVTVENQPLAKPDKPHNQVTEE